MDFRFLAALCSMFTVVTVTAAQRERSRDITWTIDETFFMSRELLDRYKRIIVQNRSGDVITHWRDGESDALEANVTHTCPWSYVSVTNENRTPRTHLEVKCLTKRCLSFSEREFVPNGRLLKPKQRMTYESKGCCSQVFAAKWVKVRQSMKNGEVKDVKRILPVAVACTCSYEPTPKRRKHQ
ncbi:unnamed protein product [Lymnaea stagnalis]|uniref:Uncharacterized protein n=1 Tax=Lymnaea stagnalis TaxID=6523 RepID=A0AAV2HPV9_LYMST